MEIHIQGTLDEIKMSEIGLGIMKCGASPTCGGQAEARRGAVVGFFSSGPQVWMDVLRSLPFLCRLKNPSGVVQGIIHTCVHFAVGVIYLFVCLFCHWELWLNNPETESAPSGEVLVSS